jgi:hypothetical protein
MYDVATCFTFDMLMCASETATKNSRKLDQQRDPSGDSAGNRTSRSRGRHSTTVLSCCQWVAYECVITNDIGIPCYDIIHRWYDDVPFKTVNVSNYFLPLKVSQPCGNYSQNTIFGICRGWNQGCIHCRMLRQQTKWQTNHFFIPTISLYSQNCLTEVERQTNKWNEEWANHIECSHSILWMCQI